MHDTLDGVQPVEVQVVYKVNKLTNKNKHNEVTKSTKTRVIVMEN